MKTKKLTKKKRNQTIKWMWPLIFAASGMMLTGCLEYSEDWAYSQTGTKFDEAPVLMWPGDAYINPRTVSYDPHSPYEDERYYRTKVDVHTYEDFVNALKNEHSQKVKIVLHKSVFIPETIKANGAILIEAAQGSNAQLVFENKSAINVVSQYNDYYRCRLTTDNGYRHFLSTDTSLRFKVPVVNFNIWSNDAVHLVLTAGSSGAMNINLTNAASTVVLAFSRNYEIAQTSWMNRTRLVLYDTIVDLNAAPESVLMVRSHVTGHPSGPIEICRDDTSTIGAISNYKSNYSEQSICENQGWNWVVANWSSCGGVQ